MELQSYLQKIRSVGQKGVRLLWILLSYATQSFLYKQATISLRLYSPDLKVSKWHHRSQFISGAVLLCCWSCPKRLQNFQCTYSAEPDRHNQTKLQGHPGDAA